MIRDSFYQYLQSEKRFSVHTVAAYKSDLSQFGDYLTAAYGISADAEITYSMVRSWLASLIDEGLTSRSVNRKLSTLKAYFRYLMKEGMISFNPVSKAISLSIPSRLPAFASVSEMESILQLPSGDDEFGLRRDLLVIEILYSTGIRLSELIGLKLPDLDRGALTIKVTGKRNKQRIIPVTKQLTRLIDEYLKLREAVVNHGVQEIIVTDQGKKAYPVFIYRLVKHYLTLAGVRGVKSPHLLRHTFATHMLNEGADLNAIKEILGHASLAATQVYTHNSIEKLKSIYKLAHPRA
ncbi:MAG: tyrosine-type recombinase/integrase [Bacteroidales bacterium]|nr:tyrosine-type recombinase/integrase [Bacteroidales bacterium]